MIPRLADTVRALQFRTPVEQREGLEVVEGSTVNLLEATRGKGLRRFINGSADNAFGHTTLRHLGPITEHSPKRFADGHYGLFKIAEEEILRQYHMGHDVPTVVVRFPLIWTQPFPPPNACCELDDR